MLPMVVRWLGLNKLAHQEREREIEAELEARVSALEEVEKRFDKLIGERELPSEVIELLRTRNQSRSQILPDNLQDSLEQVRLSASIKKELIVAERDFIYQLLRDGKISDEARRRIEYELDLEEASVANRSRTDGGWI